MKRPYKERPLCRVFYSPDQTKPRTDATDLQSAATRARRGVIFRENSRARTLPPRVPGPPKRLGARRGHSSPWRGERAWRERPWRPRLAWEQGTSGLTRPSTSLGRGGALALPFGSSNAPLALPSERATGKVPALS